ncbi:PucR family transcriptional regulator [Rhodococcus marinonascens]|uniref:PucR family transcriptional regulator n=1 Tax=Rhodococcus marinonascens TaxID=38311 RepID=UPI0009344DBA|nr:helix-turn-helix domain-containing protein [Rhodococcus marinonascens]
MRNLAKRKQESLPRWRELISGAVREVDDLVTIFLDELESVEAYQSGLVTREDLADSARESIRLILEAVTAGPETTRLSSLSLELGRQRARQGIPVEDLVAAIRLDFGILWSSLLERANSADMAVLALHVDSLWAAVDNHARAVHQSYLEEKAAMAASTRDEQQTYLAELFGPAPLVPSKVEQVARALKVDSDGMFRVVVAGPESSQMVHRIANTLAARGEHIFVLNQSGRVVILWPAPRPHTRGPETPYRQLQDIAGGMVPAAPGLAAVASAANTAHEIFRTIRPDEHGLRTLTDAWTRVTKSRLDDQADFSGHLLSGLAALTDEERDRIAETVRAYLATGSVTDTAAQLFCHRNTVLNRLGRFEKLTSLDVTVPEQAALALLALA